jgi:hypothetical protein
MAKLIINEEESPTPTMKQIARKYNYSNNSSGTDSPHEYSHSSGSKLVLGVNKFTHISKSGVVTKGNHNELFRHLNNFHYRPTHDGQGIPIHYKDNDEDTYTHDGHGVPL